MDRRALLSNTRSNMRGATLASTAGKSTLGRKADAPVSTRNLCGCVTPQLTTANSLRACEKAGKVSSDGVSAIVSRHVSQPEAYLGLCGSPLARMWRSSTSPNNVH